MLVVFSLKEKMLSFVTLFYWFYHSVKTYLLLRDDCLFFLFSHTTSLGFVRHGLLFIVFSLFYKAI